MADDLIALVEAGEYTAASLAVMLGFVGACFTALMFLRLFRWVFALFGVKV